MTTTNNITGTERETLIANVLEAIENCASKRHIGELCGQDEQLSELFQCWENGMSDSRFSALVARLSDA